MAQVLNSGEFSRYCSDKIFDRLLAMNLKNLCSSSASGHVQPTAKHCGRSQFRTNWKADCSSGVEGFGRSEVALEKG
jgi:hypothetical protein